MNELIDKLAALQAGCGPNERISTFLHDGVEYGVRWSPDGMPDPYAPTTIIFKLADGFPGAPPPAEVAEPEEDEPELSLQDLLNDSAGG